MDLHALTTKQLETQEPAPQAEVAPETPETLEESVARSAMPEHDSEETLEAQVIEGEETMPDQVQSKVDMETINKNAHDAVFWEVHGLVVYYLLMLGLTAWLLLNVWGGDLVVLKQLGLTETALEDSLLRTVGYTLVGGVFGSVLYQIRVLYKYYLRDGVYDRRWLGKYISAPWEAAAMSIVVLALIRGGMAAFGGNLSAAQGLINNFAALGTGTLVGFGMRDVIRWVQRLVQTVFNTEQPEKSAPTANLSPAPMPGDIK